MIWYQNLCPNLENLYNSVNGYFSNDQGMVLLNHAQVKASFIVQKRLKNFSVTGHEEFTDMVSYFT